MKTEKLNNCKAFQVCFITDDENGKPMCAKTASVTGENIVDAYAAAAEKYGEKQRFNVYPLATLDNPESVLDLAEYARRHFWKWELRNNNAVLSALNRSEWDTEDETQDAALSILSTLAENPAADMFTAYRAAFNSLASGRDRLFRKSEVEYNPAAVFCNPFIDRKQIATFPRLASLFGKATDSADLTEKQRDVIELYQHGITAAAVMERMNITKRAYYKLFYKGLYKILSAAIELDFNPATGEVGGTIVDSGIDIDSVFDAQETYKRRAAM